MYEAWTVIGGAGCRGEVVEKAGAKVITGFGIVNSILSTPDSDRSKRKENFFAYIGELAKDTEFKFSFFMGDKEISERDCTNIDVSIDGELVIADGYYNNTSSCFRDLFGSVLKVPLKVKNQLMYTVEGENILYTVPFSTTHPPRAYPITKINNVIALKNLSDNKDIIKFEKPKILCIYTPLSIYK